MNYMLTLVIIVATSLITYGIFVAGASTINVYTSTSGLTLPISNVSNLTGSVQCGGTDKVMNISFSDQGLSILCDADQVGGAGTLNIGVGYLYNISTSMYLNYTRITNNLTTDYPFLINGITIPISNTTGKTSAQCSSTDQRAYNLTLNNGVLSIQCGTDATGGSGATSIGLGYLYNQSQNMYLNDTLLNATYDTRYLRSVSMPYTNLTGTASIGYINLTGTASLGYVNLTGTLTSFGYANLTGTQTGIGYNNLTGTLSLAQANLTGLILPAGNITITGNFTGNQYNFTGNISVGKRIYGINSSQWIEFNSTGVYIQG
jgi:hypothetical protein